MNILQKIIDFVRFDILRISKTISEDGKYKIYSLFGINIKKEKKIKLNRLNVISQNIDDLAQSHFYLLLNFLFDRDVNKQFNIKLPLNILHAGNDYMRYVLPHNSNLKNFLEYNMSKDGLPDLIIISGIGYNNSYLRLAYIAQFYNILFVMSEDGFLARATTWLHTECEKRFIHNISFIFDSMRPYFDATGASLLENMLNDKNLTLNKEQIQRAKNLIKKITENHLTKYNHQPIFTPSIGTHNNKVLVVDQSYGDMSITRGLANDKTFESMLECAIKENPDSDIIVKTHPDTMTGKRGGYYTNLKQHDNVFPMTEPINPISIINYVDKVYVCTSQFGLEALMCGKEVHIFGMPFYAGWGLANERQSIPRRTNKRALEEVFYIAYILYTRYYNPYTKQQCEIEEAIECLLQLRAEYNEKYN